jgi:ADP-ribose pyrophosphatase
MEEAGYRAGELVWVSSYHTSKSVCVETAHLYVGRDLLAEEAMPDDTEFFEHAVMPFDEVLQLVNDSEIRDSMTVIAVLHAAQLRQTGRL